MSRNPRLIPTKRKEIIKKYIAFKIVGNIDQPDSIAWMCGVDEKTIRRDVKRMRKSGEWKEYIEATILKLASTGDIDDSTKFKEFMKIYAKEFTEKHQVETKGTHTIQVTFDKGMKDELKDKLQAPPSTNPIP